MSLTKYDSYKDSGVDWLGKIPSHWSNYRANDIGTLIRGNTGLKKDELLNQGEYVALQYGKTYKVHEINNSFEYFVNSELYKKSQIVNRGDTIIISTSETIEDLGHSCFYNRSDLGLIGGEQILFKPNSKFIIDKYLYYHSKRFCTELRKYATGLKVFRFNINDLKQILVAIPPIKEQQQIANYLDQKTKTIDKKISLLKAKTVHYKALKKSLINETVCKGLDKTVALKDSGIEWIGAIPEHWKVTRVKNEIVISKEFVGDKSNNYKLLSLTQNGVIVRDIDSGMGKFPANFDTYQVVKKGDLIFCLFDMDVTPRTVGLSYFNGMITGAYTILKSENVHANYYYYLFLMADFSKKLSKYYTGLRSTIRKERFLAIRICSPSLQEQQQIAKYLDEKTGIIDQIIENIQSQVERLKELRKSLINEVVTGKVRVPEMEPVK